MTKEDMKSEEPFDCWFCHAIHDKGQMVLFEETCLNGEKSTQGICPSCASAIRAVIGTPWDRTPEEPIVKPSKSFARQAMEDRAHGMLQEKTLEEKEHDELVEKAAEAVHQAHFAKGGLNSTMHHMEYNEVEDYYELADEVKEIDRTTVRAVLKVLEEEKA